MLVFCVPIERDVHCVDQLCHASHPPCTSNICFPPWSSAIAVSFVNRPKLVFEVDLYRPVLTNAHVVRGNSRLMPNRHCVSCTVDACLLLVIGVPVKSPFLQVHLEVAGTVFRQRRLSEYGRLNSISHQSGCLLYDCLA